MQTEKAAQALAQSKRGAMKAPAGCGKTQVIATAVAEHGGHRELILTHTHAGVDALRQRLVSLGTPASRYQIDTIAGWSLRLASGFPATTGLPSAQPRTNEEYGAVYKGVTRLAHLSPIREILRASYSGVYVDEYQDCTVGQHDLVTALTGVLPCRIVGDPLQSIFGFGDNQVVDWERHVQRSFEGLPGPTDPWRWKETNSDLGIWLQEVRERLEAGQKIDLRYGPVQWVNGSGDRQKEEFNVCMRSTRTDGETVIVIRNWPQRCHDLARKLKGLFSCVEPIDTEDLYAAAVQIDATDGWQRAVAVLDFSAKCMTQVGSKLKTIRTALENGRVPKVRNCTDQLDALLRVAKDGGIDAVESALDSVERVPRAFVYRRELLREMKRTVRAFAGGEAKSLEQAAWVIRNRTRRLGRVLPRYAVGTTLLVKGLEFDHAIVLDAEKYDAKNLYVAMTRGSRSLTIVSDNPCLRPSRATST